LGGPPPRFLWGIRHWWFVSKQKSFKNPVVDFLVFSPLFPVGFQKDLSTNPFSFFSLSPPTPIFFVVFSGPCLGQTRKFFSRVLLGFLFFFPQNPKKVPVFLRVVGTPPPSFQPRWGVQKKKKHSFNRAEIFGFGGGGGGFLVPTPVGFFFRPLHPEPKSGAVVGVFFWVAFSGQKGGFRFWNSLFLVCSSHFTKGGGGWVFFLGFWVGVVAVGIKKKKTPPFRPPPPPPPTFAEKEQSIFPIPPPPCFFFSIFFPPATRIFLIPGGPLVWFPFLFGGGFFWLGFSPFFG